MRDNAAVVAAIWPHEALRVVVNCAGIIRRDAENDPEVFQQVIDINLTGTMARTPMGRWDTTEDLIGPALFLASAGAGFITGSTLNVDGGYAAM